MTLSPTDIAWPALVTRCTRPEGLYHCIDEVMSHRSYQWARWLEMSIGSDTTSVATDCAWLDYHTVSDPLTKDAESPALTYWCWSCPGSPVVKPLTDWLLTTVLAMLVLCRDRVVELDRSVERSSCCTPLLSPGMSAVGNKALLRVLACHTT